MGGTATLNKFDDFLILNLGSCLFALTTFAVIFLIIAKSYQYIIKREFILKPIHISLIYAVLWLVIATFNASGVQKTGGILGVNLKFSISLYLVMLKLPYHFWALAYSLRY